MKSWVPALGLSGIGFFIAGCIIGGILGGSWIDDKLGTEPAFLIIGIIIGIFCACMGVYHMIKPLMDRVRKEGKDS
jgi:ATP synthase protein I